MRQLEAVFGDKGFLSLSDQSKRRVLCWEFECQAHAAERVEEIDFRVVGVFGGEDVQNGITKHHGIHQYAWRKW